MLFGVSSGVSTCTNITHSSLKTIVTVILVVETINKGHKEH